MKLTEIQKLLNEHATLPLWPQTGQVLGLTRGQTYRCAESGDIEVLKFGKLLRVRTMWLREHLGIQANASHLEVNSGC